MATLIVKESATLDSKRGYNIYDVIKVTDYPLIRFIVKDTHVTHKKPKIKDTEYNAHRIEHLQETGSLPDDLLLDDKDEVDEFTRIALAPKTTISHIRELADKLSFILMPWEYYNKTTIQDEPQSVQKQIDKFVNLMSDLFDLYVLAPIIHYDIIEHARSNDPFKPMYVPKDLETAFAVLSLTLPALRDLYARVDKLEDQLSSITAQQKQMMQFVQDQLQKIQRQIDQLREEQIRRNQELSNELQIIKKQLDTFYITEEEQREIEELRRRVLFARDPLLIAVKKNINIESEDGFAIIGPCWGPDFSSITVKLMFDGVVYEKQRILLENNPIITNL